MIKLRICQRESDRTIICKNKEIVLNNNEDRALFMIETLMEEVNEGTTEQRLKKIRKLKKLLRGFATVLGVGASITPKAFAATTTSSVLTGGAGVAITPALVMQWGLTLSLIVVAVGIAASGSLLAIAGIFRMFKKRREAEEMTVDVIKGLVQVLIAVPVVYLLFYLAQIVFKNLPVLSGLF